MHEHTSPLYSWRSRCSRAYCGSMVRPGCRVVQGAIDRGQPIAGAEGVPGLYQTGDGVEPRKSYARAELERTESRVVVERIGVMQDDLRQLALLRGRQDSEHIGPRQARTDPTEVCARGNPHRSHRPILPPLGGCGPRLTRPGAWQWHTFCYRFAIVAVDQAFFKV
jgi:hypothetical protein